MSNTSSYLDEISSDQLIEELSNRHSELLVIRNHQRLVGDKVFIKTPMGPLTTINNQFDLVEATEMLQAAQRQLVLDFLKQGMIND